MRLHHVSIPAGQDDFDAGRHFYGEVLGLKEIPPPETLGPGQVLWFQAGQCELHLFKEDNSNTLPSGRHFCLAVDDLAEVRASFTANNIETEETSLIHNRPRFFCQDPYGNRLELTQILGTYE